MTFRRLAGAIRKMVVPLSRQQIGGMHVGAGRKKEEVQLGMLNLRCLKYVIVMISRRQSDEKRSGLGMQIPLCSISQFSQEDGSLGERMGEVSRKGMQALP